MSSLFGKALRAAGSARRLERDGDYDGACDRAYYAMFNAARALLEAHGALTPDQAKTHATVLRRFSEVFVKSGLSKGKLGGSLNFVEGLRNKADYSASLTSREEALRAIEMMDEFIAFSREYLAKGENP